MSGGLVVASILLASLLAFYSMIIGLAQLNFFALIFA